MCEAESYAAKLEAIRTTVGPAPWYWHTFPQIVSASGICYDWTFHGTEGDYAYLVTLAAQDSPERPILVLGTYCRPFLIPPHCFGLWYPHQGLLNVRCFNPDALPAFSLSDLPPKAKHSGKHYLLKGDIMAKAWIDTGIPAGRHELDVPDPLSSAVETIMVAGSPEWGVEDSGCSVFSVQWKARCFDVYPQYWFNHGSFDLGYQWITRVTRDHETGRFIGDGIRIGSFELTEDGCHLERWLKSGS